jgi:hypothetical protein
MIRTKKEGRVPRVLPPPPMNNSRNPAGKRAWLNMREASDPHPTPRHVTSMDNLLWVCKTDSGIRRKLKDLHRVQLKTIIFIKLCSQRSKPSRRWSQGWIKTIKLGSPRFHLASIKSTESVTLDSENKMRPTPQYTFKTLMPPFFIHPVILQHAIRC